MKNIWQIWGGRQNSHSSKSLARTPLKILSPRLPLGTAPPPHRYPRLLHPRNINNLITKRDFPLFENFHFINKKGRW